MDVRAVLQVIDSFIPIDFLTAVLVVFAGENLFELYIAGSIPPRYQLLFWLATIGIGLYINYITMSEQERDELEDELEDVRD